MDHNNYIISPFTIDSLIKKYMVSEPEINFTPYIIALIGFSYVVIKLMSRIYHKQFANHSQSFLLETFSLLALIPNLVNTDTQQLLYSIPLIAFLTQYLLLKRKPNILIPYIILFFFFSVDQPDLLGRSLSESFYEYGIAGIGNLLIVGLSWLIFYNERNKLFENSTAANLNRNT